MIDLDLFFDISRDVAMATDFVQRMANSPLLSLWHSETVSVTPCYGIKMADASALVLNDVLCFVKNKFCSALVMQLRGVIVEFYSLIRCQKPRYVC